MIFVAEVASTFNEQLLGKHLLERAPDDRHRAYLVNRLLDAMRGTIFRQTMFAEFEKITHGLAERTSPSRWTSSRKCITSCWRPISAPISSSIRRWIWSASAIPHFYRGFYVYKYATGMSAAIALADRVTKGGPRELADYLGFLKGGCSKDPLDLLRGRASTWSSPRPSTPPWTASPNWSRSWIGCFSGTFELFQLRRGGSHLLLQRLDLLRRRPFASSLRPTVAANSEVVCGERRFASFASYPWYFV